MKAECPKMEVSASIAPHRAVLGNTMPSVKLQPSDGLQ
jgi:hypothetical protein